MKISNKLLIIIVVMMAGILVGCKGSPTPAAPSGDTSSNEEGSAMIVYEYSDEQDIWVLSVYAAVPVTIKRDEDFPEKWLVQGSKDTMYYTQGKSFKQDGSPCFISCDFKAKVAFTGELITALDKNNKPTCQIKVKNFFVIDLQDYERYGDCPMGFTEIFDCAATYVVYGELPEQEWIFDKQNRILEVSRPKGQTLKATIKDIQWPGDKGQVCKWDQ